MPRLRNTPWNPSPVAFPHFRSMEDESSHDRHATADSRVSGMAETKQEFCRRGLCHSRDIAVLASS